MTWLRGRSKPRVTEASASVLIPGVTRKVAWAFLHSAENASSIDPTIARAYSVPGTGPGVGERQSVVRRCPDPCGNHEVVQSFEITEIDDEHVVYVSVGAPPVRTRLDVRQVQDGVCLTWAEAITAQVDEVALRRGIQALLANVKDHLGSGQDQHG